jgi:hypothetical protein
MLFRYNICLHANLCFSTTHGPNVPSTIAILDAPICMTTPTNPCAMQQLCLFQTLASMKAMPCIFADTCERQFKLCALFYNHVKYGPRFLLTVHSNFS